MPIPNKIPTNKVLSLNDLHFATKYADLATAVALIGATETTLVIEESEAITDDLTIPATMTLLFLRGGEIAIANTKTLTVNGAIDAGPWPIFTWTGTGTVAGLRKMDFLRPEWFGAKGDYDPVGKTGTSDTAAFQKAFDAMMASSISKLKITDSAYYLASKVNIEAPGQVVIEGPGGALSEESVSHYNFYGSSGLDTMFDIGNGSASVIWSVEFNGVKFCATTDVDDVECAIKITSKYTGPIWPLMIQRCNFYGFNTAAIYQIQGDLAYSLAFVSVTKSAFWVCEYALLVEPGNRCVGLYWVDNRCHQGGKIEGTLHGPIRISDNNFEGQAVGVTIDLTIDNNCPRAIIENNYFESNEGDHIIRVGGSTLTDGYVLIQGNSYTSCTVNVSYISLGAVNARVFDPVTVSGTRLSGLSVLDKIAGVTQTSYCMAADEVLRKGLPSGADAVRADSLTIDAYTQTPFGMKGYEEIADNSGQLFTFPAFSVPMADDDLIVVNVLVKYYDLTFSVQPNLVLYDAASNLLVSALLPGAGNDDWCVFTYMFKLTALPATPAALRIYFRPYGAAGSGDGCQIGGYGAYKIAAADIATTEISPYIHISTVLEAWTPTITFGGAAVGVTYDASTTGYYTKDGRRITFSGRLKLTNKGTSVGDAYIGGLPYTCLNALGAVSPVALRPGAITFANQMFGAVLNNTATIYLCEATEGGVETALTNADFANTSSLFFSGSYIIDD